MYMLCLYIVSMYVWLTEMNHGHRQLCYKASLSILHLQRLPSTSPVSSTSNARRFTFRRSAGMDAAYAASRCCPSGARMAPLSAKVCATWWIQFLPGRKSNVVLVVLLCRTAGQARTRDIHWSGHDWRAGRNGIDVYYYLCRPAII